MADVERIDPIQGEIVHVYDGIEEADNQLPTWWLWTFYLAIAFSVFYWVAYHELETLPLPMERYAKELQERAAGGEVSEELLTALVADPDAVNAGRAHFTETCVVCHADRGEGNIGPNLTDGYWIHGGGPLDIHATISDGVLDSGMPAWGGALGAEAVQQLTAYVLSIRGTNLPGKEPQGDLWTGAGGADTEESEPVDAVDEAEPVTEEEAAAAVDTAHEAGALDADEAEVADQALEADAPLDAEEVHQALGGEGAER